MMETLLAQPEAIYFIYTALAVGVFAVCTGIFQAVKGSENRSEARSRRMKMIEKGASTAEILAILKPADQGHWLTRVPLISDLPLAMRQAGMLISPSTVISVCLALSLVITLGAAIKFPLLQATLIGLAVGFLLPIMLIRSRRKSRVGAMIKMLPDALELMARGLRVGHPLNTSIRAVASDMPDPIGTEFGLIADQVSFGDDLVDAFAEFADRMGIEDVYYLAASIGIQHGTGGDLARVLDILSKVVRNRISMRRRIEAISAEGRLSGYFLSALPFVILGGTSIMSPDYYAGVYNDPLFLPMALAVLTFTVLNGVILAKLVRFKI